MPHYLHSGVKRLGLLETAGFLSQRGSGWEETFIRSPLEPQELWVSAAAGKAEVRNRTFLLQPAFMTP